MAAALLAGGGRGAQGASTFPAREPASTATDPLGAVDGIAGGAAGQGGPSATAIGSLAGIDFADAERLAVVWGAARRTSAGRRFDYGPAAQLRFSADDDPIAASLYSLPASMFSPADALGLLAAVHAAAPARTLLAMVDLPMRQALAPRAAALGVQLLDTWGRPLSPWPRDPMSLTHLADGGLAVVVRPNVQAGREEDLHFGPQLVDDLPDALDHAWGGAAGGVRWTAAPVPFHNGQVLLTRDAAWITLHTLEPRILALLGVDRVPVPSFATAAGISSYVAAARRAAAELAAMYGRPVRFVHPLPEPPVAAATTIPLPDTPSNLSPASSNRPQSITGGPGGDPGAAAAPDAPARPGDLALMHALGGGAGYDLDSVLTLLPATAQAPGGSTPVTQPVALVGSIDAGRRLLAGAAVDDVAAMGRAYGLAAPAGQALEAALAAAQREERPQALDRFLDLLAQHLAAQGFAVRRLPLIAVPTVLLAGRHLGFAEFLITWNNVVVEARRGEARAEGFASLLAAGDALARREFGAAGCRLDLLPPLVESVIFNGGYRCASNQLRAAPAPPSSPTRDATRRRH